MESTGHN